MRRSEQRQPETLPTAPRCDITHSMNRHAAQDLGRGQHAVLLPGDLLRDREQWASYAATLPAQTVLVVLPDHETRLSVVLDLVAAQIAAAGRPVTRLSAQQLGPQRGIQAALPLA